jgi:hypothetical protein
VHRSACSRRGAHQAGAEIGTGRAGLDNDEVDSEGRDLLDHGLDEAFDAPFGRVIEAEARVRDLAALGRDLHNSSTSLPPQVWYGRADELDRAGRLVAI